MNKNKRFNNILAILYITLNIVFIYQIFKLATLPFKYNLIISAILALFVFLLVLGLYKSKKKFMRSFNKFLVILISLGLLVANLYMYKFGSFLNKVTDGLQKKEVVSVIVRKDSNYETLEDVANLVFAIEDEHEPIVFEALEDFEKQLNQELIIKDSENYQILAQELLNEDHEVIVVNEAYRNFIHDEIPDFDEQTKVIAKFEKVEDIASSNKSVTKETFTVLISGIDVYGDIANNARTDVNILATVNPQTKEILLTSIPRDYYLPLACRDDNLDKLTHTGIYGIDCTMDTVGRLFDVEIDFYARVNFSSLINVVDAVGGVNVYNDWAFSVGDQHFPVGDIYLDGDLALMFVRDRYNHPDGDLARGRNQMKVMEAIINKMASPALITNFNSILSTLEGTFQTNMSSKDINSLVRMQLNDFATWDIKQIQVAGTGATDYSYALGDYAYVMYPNYDISNEYYTTVNEAKVQIKNMFE